MHVVLIFLIVIAMLATLGVLVAGIIGMFRGNDPKRSNKLMQSRVLLQAVALVLFALFMAIYKK
jgi:hypothetical protein